MRDFIYFRSRRIRVPKGIEDWSKDFRLPHKGAVVTLKLVRVNWRLCLVRKTVGRRLVYHCKLKLI